MADIVTWASATPLLTPLHSHLALQSLELCTRLSVPSEGGRRPDTPHLAATPHLRTNRVRMLSDIGAVSNDIGAVSSDNY
jgi:hypothetical protein